MGEVKDFSVVLLLYVVKRGEVFNKNNINRVVLFVETYLFYLLSRRFTDDYHQLMGGFAI